MRFKRTVSRAPFQILLYYLYSKIEDPDAYQLAHMELCQRLGLLGRIIVAKEGINGTVSGSADACEAYREALKNDGITKDIVFKIDSAEAHAFPKMSIKVREEIVTLGLEGEDFSPEETTATHLPPQDFREMMDDENVVILDARNDYEWKLGRFENAILPEVESFKDLPKWVRDHKEDLEGKKILTYCTGGIRCEKFSGFLLREGFEDVYQLEGGIVEYGKDEKVRGEKFEGSLYVFDERIGVPVNRTDGARVIAACKHCGDVSDRYVNCVNADCNEQFFCCESCEDENQCCCSESCLQIVTEH